MLPLERLRYSSCVCTGRIRLSTRKPVSSNPSGSIAYRLGFQESSKYVNVRASGWLASMDSRDKSSMGPLKSFYLLCYRFMSIQKIRWSRVYESAEEELMAFLQSRNLHAARISAEASSEQVQRTAEQGAAIWCAEGSLSVRTGSTTTSLQPGDALRFSAETTYDLHPGISGYVCYVTG